MSSQREYLMKNYMSDKPKKKKKTKTVKGSAIFIQDDEDPFLKSMQQDDEDLPVFVQEESQSWMRFDNDDVSDTETQRGRRRKSPSPSPEPERRRRKSPTPSPPPSPGRASEPKGLRMADGTGAGLQTAESLKRDLERNKAEKQRMYQHMDASASGKDAKTVYRSKFGKKVDVEQEQAAILERQRIEQEQEAAKEEWKRGVKQKQESERLKERLEKEKFQPLAVYRDDKELNEVQRDRDRWGDPMAHLTTSKKKKRKGKSDRIMYQGHWAPNRFNIPPGYRWDGVDRSNGFEGRYFSTQNAKLSRAEDEYKWATEDM